MRTRIVLVPAAAALVAAYAFLFAGAIPAGSAAAADGPEFVLQADPASPFVSFRIWVRTGSAHDPAGKEGLACLTGSLIGRGGTVARSYDEILQALFPMAAGYDVTIDREMTVLEGTVHKDHLGTYYELIRDALLAPAFREDDFARLQAEQVNTLRTRLRYGDDEELAKAVLTWVAFAGTSYAHPEEGLVQSVEKLAVEDVREFHGAHFTRDNIVVGLAGCFGDEFVARMRQDLARLPAGPAPAFVPPEPPKRAPGRRVFLIEKDTRATAISFGHPIAITRAADDFYPLMVANSWLGEHRSSAAHLYQVMRTARGLNYGDYSYIEYFDHGSRRQVPAPNHARHRQMFEVWIRPVTNANRHFALRQAVREVTRLVQTGLRPEELELTRNYLLNFSRNYATTESMRLGYALDDRFYGLPESHLDRLRSRLAAVEIEEVRGALRRHIRPGSIDIVMVTQDAEALKRALTADAFSPIRYASPASQAILEEDELIQEYPLGVAEENVVILPVESVFER